MSEQTAQTTPAEAAVAFGETVASVLAAAGGNARTVAELDAIVELRSHAAVLTDHRNRLAETGLPGLLVPAEHDGLGLLEEGGATVALVAVARAAGAVPGPDLAAPWAVAPTILRLARADPALLSSVAAGELRLAVVDLGDARGGSAEGLVRVVDGEGADGLLVLEPGRISLVSDPRLFPVATFDPTRPVSTIARTELLAGGASILAEGPEADRIAAAARAVGRVVLAGELHGTGKELLRLVVEHLRTRVAFGRPIGSFQALKHRTADLWSELSLVGSLVDEAASRLDAVLSDGDEIRDDDPLEGDEEAGAAAASAAGSADAAAEAAAYAAAALSLAADTVVHGGEEVLQLHGGIGYTWESPVHVLLKRAVASRSRWGTPHELRRLVAVQFDL